MSNLNIINKAILKDNKTILLFSLKMSKKECVSNILLSKSKIEKSKIEKEELTDTDWHKIILTIEKLLNAKLYIDDTSPITIEEIKEKCIKLKKEKYIDLIVIDNIELITTNKNIQDKVSYINNELKKLEQELDISIITTSTTTAYDM